MAVYTISFLTLRKRDNGDSEVMPYMQVVSTNAPDRFDVAIKHIKTNFPDTKYGINGWDIQGDLVCLKFMKAWVLIMVPYVSYIGGRTIKTKTHCG